MAITLNTVFHNHRGLAFIVTGDGATTTFTIPLGPQYARPFDETGVCAIVTAPTKYSHGSGKGGFYTPDDGTPVAVTSSSVTNNILTVQTTTAIGSAVAAYGWFIFTAPSARN